MIISQMRSGWGLRSFEHLAEYYGSHRFEVFYRNLRRRGRLLPALISFLLDPSRVKTRGYGWRVSAKTSGMLATGWARQQPRAWRPGFPPPYTISFADGQLYVEPGR
jgi:hypothetical protein